jgi:hypothetical protein
MALPDYLVCLNCESPCYVFEWDDIGKVTEALCQVCGNDELDEFSTPEDFEELTADDRWGRRSVKDPKLGPVSSDPHSRSH